jgi:hypothetical protein
VEAVTFDLPVEGGCTCGAVRYRVAGQPIFLTCCHCLECQRASGSAFGMSLRLKRTDIALTKGELKRYVRTADSGQPVGLCFCVDCGCRIWHEPSETEFVHLKPGTLDDPSVLKPQYEGWKKRKHAWLHLDNIIAGFDTVPPPRDQRGIKT